MDLDLGANRVFDESQVPEHLSHLIPVVKRWGFSKSSEQDAFVKAMIRERPDEVLEFSVLYDRNRDAILEWQNSIPWKHISDMTSDDWHHPKWAFTALYKIRELTGPGMVTAAEIQAKERFHTEQRIKGYRMATVKADEAFRLKRYEEFVRILSDYEDLLSEVQIKKMDMAKRSVN